ncbi:MAG: hypothetical protein QOD76_1467 [Solirubrobacteraceae bacterium]|nr:hypothetical protein [Solirubrobacteraceae bacterium]
MPSTSASTDGRVALVHDFLLDLRGAERVFAAICDSWPDADLFTAVYDERGTEGRFAGRRMHTSFLQATRPTARTFRAFLALWGGQRTAAQALAELGLFVAVYVLGVLRIERGLVGEIRDAWRGGDFAPSA